MSVVQDILQEILARANESKATVYRRYFRTAPGEYGHGDVFAGVTVPEIRAIEKSFHSRMQLKDTVALLQEELHEARLLAAIHLANRFRQADSAERSRIFEVYLANARRINNWDIVDASAPHIVGAHLLKRDRSILFRLAQSTLLWERRIAVVSTLHFIRHGDLDATFDLCVRLLEDPHDLIHKACGWMLREAGKRDPGRLLAFLEAHAAAMPRVQLRYALEKFPPDVRSAFMKASQKMPPAKEPRRAGGCQKP